MKTVSKGDYLYAVVPDHLNCTDKGYVLFHRVVVEQHLGRYLTKNEVVHHTGLHFTRKTNLVKLADNK